MICVGCIGRRHDLGSGPVNIKKSFITHGERKEPTSPIVFDNPHSGRELPDHFQYDCPKEELMAFGDLHVEKLLRDVPKNGIPVLEACIHRAVIDLNRHEYEIDTERIKCDWPHPAKKTKHTKNGLSLIPVRLGQPFPLTPVFNHHSCPTTAEIEKRIKLYHRPYYKKLQRLLDNAHKKFGFCIHMDIHSMRRTQNSKLPDIVIGNLDGTSCNDILNKFIAGFFKAEGLSVKFNKPFNGASLIKHTSDLSYNRNSLQIEIARDLYMDYETLEFDENKGGKLRDMMTRFTCELHKFTIDHAAELKKQASPKTPSQDDNSNLSNSPRLT